MSGYTHVVTLGRNVGDSPMSTPRWRLFKAAVKSALMNNGVSIVSVPHKDEAQQGVWEGLVCEECAVFIGLSNGAVANLDYTLGRLAQTFQQQAIGHIVVSGQEHLVKPL